MLIPAPTCSNENTSSDNDSVANKLKESDFPMTQLIKERTINYVNASSGSGEEGSNSDDKG